LPKRFWLTPEEKEAIIRFAQEHPYEGYRRLAFMMIDKGVVAASPSTVYRVLKASGLLERRKCKRSKKGKGFEQPTKPHEHWHLDIMFVRTAEGTCYLFSVLDGYSRYVIHWELRESITQRDAQLVIQTAHEIFPDARPRLITDNGSQFVSKEFRSLVRMLGMNHVRTSPHYPQSNAKDERYFRTVREECIDRTWLGRITRSRRVAGKHIDYYNNDRLHSGIGYVPPRDMLEGRAGQIAAERRRGLAEARAAREKYHRSRERAENKGRIVAA